MDTARKRILYFIENQGIAPSDFLANTGLKKGFIDRSHQDSGASDIYLSKILEAYPRISANWLLTGKGAMLIEENSNGIQPFKLRTDNNVDSQLIPIYNLEATAGLVNLFQKQGDTSPIDHLRIPNLPKCDGAVFVTGDSMYPLLKSGDIVAYKEIKDLPNEIFWGEMYIVSVEVAGEEFVSVKYIQKSDLGTEYITLVSHNQHHSPKNIHLSKVRAMAMVKASVRLNSMS